MRTRYSFQKRTSSLLLFLLAAGTHPDPQTLLDQAIATDLGADTPRAFALYRGAAEAGLPAAQLNVAVMYDSGRGTPRNAIQAATWYAAAASGGEARAAFDLGQLYESGDGVPRSPALAHAWYAQAAAEGLPAAANRPPAPPTDPAQPLAAPAIAYPEPGATLAAPQGGLALVWTATPTPAAAAFFVQVMQVAGTSPSLAFSTTIAVTATRMPTPRPGRYAWRVFVLCPSLGRYAPSAWAAFSIA